MTTERSQCVGLVLAAVGKARLAHDWPLVTVLENLALEMEHAGTIVLINDWKPLWPCDGQFGRGAV